MPLPPYIKTELLDAERYQTVYSRVSGSAAAPTAGLHFTQTMLSRLKEEGVLLAFVTLHVGLGTFRPVKVNDITEHKMHAEYCMIPAETAEKINRTKQNGGRVICVGTTSCRTIESFANQDGTVSEAAGWTDIFIFPGYRFKVTDALITNFHLPKVRLSCSCPLWRAVSSSGAYREAVELRVPIFQLRGRDVHSDRIEPFGPEKK
jgi:S-adenosylmethionine:tRNA ribosyltransferase-isomerase